MDNHPRRYASHFRSIRLRVFGSRDGSHLSLSRFQSAIFTYKRDSHQPPVYAVLSTHSSSLKMFVYTHREQFYGKIHTPVIITVQMFMHFRNCLIRSPGPVSVRLQNFFPHRLRIVSFTTSFPAPEPTSFGVFVFQRRATAARRHIFDQICPCSAPFLFYFRSPCSLRDVSLLRLFLAVRLSTFPPSTGIPVFPANTRLTNTMRTHVPLTNTYRVY